jgi:hypothetical protein
MRQHPRLVAFAPRSSFALALAAALLLAPLLGCAKREVIAEEAAPRAARADGVQTVADREQRAPASSPAAAASQVPVTAPDAGRKLVKTVDLELRVKDTAAAAEKLRALATHLGGFVSALSAERHDDLLYYTLTLRVPVDHLEDALGQARGLADRVERESIKTEDVTEHWVDLDARLTTLHATENELRQLLTEARQRGQKVEDIMAVYDKLTEIRSTSEQLEGERKVLAGLTSLSTINVTLSPTEGAKPIAAGWQPGDTVRQSFRALLHGLQAIGDLLIVVLVVVLPMALVVFGPVWLLVRVWRRRRARRAES